MTTMTRADASEASVPAGRRYVPTRAGIVNLWDYRDEEFVFADGRLVLRGPNGSGKTKALEVLFPFVLDGRIEPRRLNPFASEERTMKSNLLYRGQEAAYAYVWLEFGNGVDHVTVGVGLRAQRHSDKVTRWYFVTDGRVGVDFSLLEPDDRPMTRKQLAAQLGAEVVHDSAEEHRAAVDARLFGLGRERFDQLLTLVLTLRRPQLAKNLDPGRLSDTLSDGLRPVDEDLLVEAARSFDDMEAVQRTLDGLIAADEATRAFLSVYTTYLRVHARAAADAVARRRDAVTGQRRELSTARAAGVEAGTRRAAALAALEEAENAPPRLRAHLDRLKSSAAYQSHEQLADLERLVRELAESAERAGAAVAARRSQAARRRDELAAAEKRLVHAEAEAARAAEAFARDAEDAGIAWSVADAESDGFVQRVAARVAARRDDVAAVRAASARLEQSERDRGRASQAVARARTAVDEAEAVEQAALARVEGARRDAHQQLAAWAQRHGPTLAAVDITGVVDQVAGAIDTTGEPDAADPRVAYAQATAEATSRLRDELARLRAERSTVDGELSAARQERDRIAAERDDAPQPFGARPAPRADRAGAPLWRLVRFADGLSETDAAAVEAALEAANLLDAWVHPTDADTTAALSAGNRDGYLVPLPPLVRPSGRSLADALTPEEQAHVDPARVAAVLASVALVDGIDAPGAAPAVSVAGQFAQGIQVGGYAKPAPEYIGATARARRRAARLADCERQIAELAGRLDGLARQTAARQAGLDAIAAAGQELPRVSGIIDALRSHDRAAATMRARQEAAEAASSTLDAAIAEVGAAELALRRMVAERALAADAVEEVAGAIRRVERDADRLSGARREVGQAQVARSEADGRLGEAHDAEVTAAETRRAAAAKHDTEAEQLRTLRDTVGAEAEVVLADVARTETAISEAERVVAVSRSAAVDAEKAVAAAQATEQAAVAALRTAVVEEQEQAQSLAPFAHDDLLALLRCPTELRWPAQHADWPAVEAVCAQPDAPSLPVSVARLHEAVLTATRDLTPSESSIKQSATRLTKALDDLQGQLSAAGQDHRPEWIADDGVIVVRVADEQGYAPVKVFADRIAAARRDQEVLLTESERRILEDTLLAQLARQIHQRTVDARDLVGAMDRDMRARRMSSGVSIGVGWHIADNLDEEQRALCKLFDRDAAALGPDDMARMRRHFAERIKAARAVRAERSYRELLGDVLDYRRWRVFAFKLHRPGGNADALTRARHSQLSGGEQSVSLHLPLFAAAHALFRSARPGCPRLLALDEAFAGVDDTGRAELMALTVQFDLDLFMTGYDLWATYPSVPGCAHYDLSHAAVDHTVSAVLLVWDGAQNLADFDGSLTAALGSPGTRRRPATEAVFAPGDVVGTEGTDDE